tara:strand:+ start:455 stop:739 length:285 start_codon:yes stop_codon:yes gene_type:complete
MRKMQDKYQTIKVIRHFNAKCPIITDKVEIWEYFIIDDPEMNFHKDDDIQYALVLGWHDEFGTVSIKDLKQRAITDTTDLSKVAPAPDWRWIDD